MSEEKKDEPKETPETEPAAEPQISDNGEKEKLIPKSRFDEVNKGRKAAEKELAAYKKASAEAEEKRLQDNEEYKTLSDKYAKEIAELKPRAEVGEEQEKTLQKILEARIERIPEHLRALVPSGYSTMDQLKYIEDNDENLTKPSGPNISAGVKGGSQEHAALSPEESAMAANQGLTDAQYAAGKNK